MRVELIFSTYNAPRALWLTLLSVTRQRRRPDSLCVADDGSGPETAEVIERFRAEYPDLPIRHVWHEDNGFEKNAILNKAVASSDAEFLVFTDGDCLLSPGYVARHVAMARPDRYSCGSLIRLTDAATKSVTDEDVLQGRVFARDWLRARDTFDRTTTWLKTMPLPFPLQWAMDRLSPVRRTWCGANASAFRDAILKVNGFDEEIKYGGGDKEFGVRMKNAGVHGRHLRFTAPVVHLDHPRGYADPVRIAAQKRRIAEVRSSGRYWTADGVVKAPSPPASS